MWMERVGSDMCGSSIALSIVLGAWFDPCRLTIFNEEEGDGVACAWVCVHACMRAYVHVCMHACVYVCMYACVHVRVCGRRAERGEGERGEERRSVGGGGGEEGGEGGAW